jgi:hypothetical protein
MPEPGKPPSEPAKPSVPQQPQRPNPTVPERRGWPRPPVRKPSLYEEGPVVKWWDWPFFG